MIPKFRAWHKELKTMFEVKSLVFTLNLATIVSKNDLFPSRTCSFDDIILMQSTGLFDKNGVEIFEKDIVMDDSGKINKIVFTEYEDTDYYGQTHMGFISENNDYVDQFVTLPSLIKKGIKIIGNIYELESVEE